MTYSKHHIKQKERERTEKRKLKGYFREYHKKNYIKINNSNWNKGENHPNWKGGITSINQQIRHSIEYKLWRASVFERDDYTCIWCKQVGGTLNADHIKPFALFPELRFAIDNGRTLCISCHRKTSTYGNKSIKIKFIGRKIKK